MTIQNNISWCYTISYNISRYITILDETLSIYNNTQIGLKIIDELSTLKRENTGQYWAILGNIGQHHNSSSNSGKMKLFLKFFIVTLTVTLTLTLTTLSSYIWYIYLRYTWGIPKMYPRWSLDIPKICKRYTRDITDIYLRFTCPHP